MKAFLVLALIFVIPLSCKKGNDIFATINGGNITRSEFNDWLESRNIPQESVYKDRYSMSDYLRQIAVEKLTVIKAEKAEYNKEKKYKTLENTLYKNLLATFFMEKKRNEITFNEKAADLSIIRIFLKKDHIKDFLIEENKKKLIHALITELRSGKDFNDLAAKYSEDAASQKKGHLGIVPENVMEEGIKNAINLLKENQYTEEPVKIGNSLCLIKLHKRYNLSESNIKKIVTNKENSERIIDFYNNKALDELLNKLLKEKNIVTNINKAIYCNNNEVIFSIEGEGFTSGDLDDILKLFYSLRYGAPASSEFSLNEKKITSEKIFKEHLFASEAKRCSFDEDVKFKRSWFYLKRATLAGAYKYDVLMKDALVTNEDIWKEYAQNKTSKYYKIKKKNNKEIKVFLPYTETQLSIKKQLYREKLKSLKKKWDNEILNDGDYKIVNKDFLIN